MSQQTGPLDPGDEGFVAPGSQALAGVVTDGNGPGFTPGVQVDYFGYAGGGQRFYLPDGISYFEFKAMNEGEKKKFQKNTSRDLTVKKGGDASMRMDVAEERWQLILTVTTGWNLGRMLGPDNFQAVPFSDRAVAGWLEIADPKIVADYEFAIRKANPWLQGDMSSQDIQDEIDRLTELKRDVKAEEDRKALSSSN